MPPKTPANSSRRATPESLDTLKDANAALHEECDRHRRRNERLQDKLSEKEEKISKYEDKLEAANREARRAKEEIKRLLADLSSVNAKCDTMEKGFKQLLYEKEAAQNDLTRLKASYESLKLKYDAIPEERRNPMTAALPERSKRSSGGTTASATSVNSGGSSSRAQQEAERGRRQAQKDRLGARFDTNKRPPPSGGNRSSFIEGFGSRRRSMSSSRAVYGDVAHTSFGEPLISPRDSVSFSTVPRRIPSSNGYNSGGSSAVMDDDYEDGDYHLRPIH